MAASIRIFLARVLVVSVGAALAACSGGQSSSGSGAAATADAAAAPGIPGSRTGRIQGSSSDASLPASGSAAGAATVSTPAVATPAVAQTAPATTAAPAKATVSGPAPAQSPAPVTPPPAPITHSTPTRLSIPAAIKSTGHQNDALVLAGYLDVRLYGADPTGKNDSTAAFQQAMLDASGDAAGSTGTSMLVYVPVGTYLISNTLTGYQGCGSNGSVPSNMGFGSIQKYGAVSGPGLVGPASGPRPTIVLKDNTFTNPANPQPMIHIVNSPNAGVGACGYQATGSTAVGAFDILFNAVVRDINVTTGNNPGAIGVQFYSAQTSYMQNVLVNATNGYIGLQGAPATEVWTNVEVNGGQYGVWIDKTAGVSTIAGLTLENQTVAGVYFDAVGDLSISGFNIQETNPGAAAIVADAHIAQGSTLSLMDGALSTTGATQAAIVNRGGDGLYLNDVYVQAPGSLIANGGSTTIPASGGWQLIGEYSHADQNTNGNNSSNPGYALASLIVVNDVAQPAADYGPAFGAAPAAPPTDLVIRHLPGQMPWAFDANALWVTDFGADPTGFTDSTAQIQNAINAAHANGGDEVFLPRGSYSISATLKLYPNTQFFGVPGGLSQLLGYGWVTHHTLQPYLQVGDAVNNAAASSAGRAIVSDIGIGLPSNAISYAPYAKLLPNQGAGYDPADQTYLYAIDWQTGRSSVANQVSIGYQGLGKVSLSPATRNLVQIDQSGGGRWYGLQVAGGMWNSASGNSFYVTGTFAPISVYGSNIEHAAGASFYAFSNASNIRVLGAKTEDGTASYWFSVVNSSNVLLSGLTSHQSSSLYLSNSTNVEVNTLDFYSISPSEGQTVSFITDDKTSYPAVDSYALFKLNKPGTNGFNNANFPHCGDAVCDGGETALNCPSDCGSSQ